MNPTGVTKPPVRVHRPGHLGVGEGDPPQPEALSISHLSLASLA